MRHILGTALHCDKERRKSEAVKRLKLTIIEQYFTAASSFVCVEK
jgi:hypothetical protein